MSQSEELATRTIRAEIDLLNKDGRIWDGMYGQALIVLDKHPDAITIPGTAIVTEMVDQKGAHKATCFRVVHGHAVRASITPRWDNGQQVEVLDGLKPGDVVIVEGADRIQDGQAIESAR
ncbi:MAG: efflux RND transporter periplasmic adaptor subunit [Isosphaeraceae bacterium]